MGEMGSPDEKQKLIGVVIAAEETGLPVGSSQAPSAVAVSNLEEVNEWDGHLLQCCGTGDRHGLAAFASTLCCLPCVVA